MLNLETRRASVLAVVPKHHNCLQGEAAVYQRSVMRAELSLVPILQLSVVIT